MYEVSMLSEIDYGATGDLEIIQNVQYIMSTYKHSVVMDRSIGVNIDLVDEPIDNATSLWSAELIEIIEINEPRVRVEEVTFEADPHNGKLTPKVMVNIQSDNEV